MKAAGPTLARAIGGIQRRIHRWRRPAATGLVLLYHRVASLETDPQQLAISPRHFAAQLEMLRGWGEPLRLEELADPAARKPGSKPFYVITFDDGYADNLLEAAPLLARYETPATVFVATGYLNGETEFWWDELERLLLRSPKLPGHCPPFVQARWLRDKTNLDLEFTPSQLAAYRDWDITRKETPTLRHQLYRDLCETLRRQTVDVREAHLTELRQWAGVSAAGRATHRALQSDELRQLCASDLVDIGAHTVLHPSLAALPHEQQLNEIRTSRKTLRDLTGRTIDTFSYPFGSADDYNDDSVSIVRQLGFTVVCANEQGAVRETTDSYRLPRRLVRDWPADYLLKRLKKWIRR